MEALKLTYDSSISDIRDINSSFDIGKLRICYTGANRNKTYFSKDTLRRAIPTLFNCPVVVNYDRDSGTFGAHDVEVITDYDNQLRMVNITQPVGVIPESANVFFEDFEEENGEVHEYLCADVILWKRQEAYKAIKENGIVAESMEINVNAGDRVDDVYVVNDFEFTAFALLGNDVEPCFESASLQTYSLGSEFKEEFAQMMDEFKRTFNLATTPSGVDGYNKNSKEGGDNQMVDENKKFSEEAEVIEEVTDTVEDTVTDPEPEEENFALDSNLREAIYGAFADLTVMTEYGEMPQYCICDFDFEAKMIYAWETADWVLYGFTYDMDGDNVKVDFDSKKRMKYVIAEFDEGETQDSPFASAYEQMTESIHEANENVSELKDKYQAASEKIDELNSELEKLRAFKSEIEDATDKAQRDELFAQFTDLSDVEEFKALVENSSEYDLDALEEKCFALRGRNMKFNLVKGEVKTPKLPIMPKDDSDEKEPYNGLIKKYLGK